MTFDESIELNGLQRHCFKPIFARNFHSLYNNRNAQNMSQFNLLGQTIIHMPDMPNLNHTLLFIETNKYFPMNSAVSLDKNVYDKFQDFDDSELSLELKLEHAKHETISSASTIKKKKTGCTCKKTKCLKMYCQCFSTGKMCTPQCSCYGCSNDHDHIDCIAKAKEIVKTKISTATKQNQGKGCHCKKSQCQKKYCECFNSGLACGIDCKCQDCANGQCSDHGNRKSIDSQQISVTKRLNFSDMVD